VPAPESALPFVAIASPLFVYLFFHTARNFGTNARPAARERKSAANRTAAIWPMQVTSRHRAVPTADGDYLCVWHEQEIALGNRCAGKPSSRQ
jgi:hypothetical protein